MVFLIFALARPQRSLDQSKRSVEGLDIIMVIDTSGSMLTQDFALGGRAASRVDVVKAVIAEFIRNRPDDRIGMVVFAAEAYTHAPLTFDHDALISMLDDVRPGPAGESTSIGEGLGVAVKRMQKVTAKSKVVVLLTDGGNTSGRLSPDGATQAAAEVGVKVYTIGIGGKSGGERGKKGGKADLDVDVDLLTRIATKTGGKFFLASDTDALLKIYRTIDELEKTKADFRQFRKVEEHFVIFVWPAVLCLLLEVLWTCTRFRPIQYLPSANHKPMAAHIAPGAKS